MLAPSRASSGWITAFLSPWPTSPGTACAGTGMISCGIFRNTGPALPPERGCRMFAGVWWAGLRQPDEVFRSALPCSTLFLRSLGRFHLKRGPMRRARKDFPLWLGLMFMASLLAGVCAAPAAPDLSSPSSVQPSSVHRRPAVRRHPAATPYQPGSFHHGNCLCPGPAGPPGGRDPLLRLPAGGAENPAGGGLLRSQLRGDRGPPARPGDPAGQPHPGGGRAGQAGPENPEHAPQDRG